MFSWERLEAKGHGPTWHIPKEAERNHKKIRVVDVTAEI
jgi:hypothetical protein